VIRAFQILLVVALLVAVASSCRFSTLEDDLGQLDEVAYLFAGRVTTVIPDTHAIVVVAMRDDKGKEVVSFRMLAEPGAFEIRAQALPTRFFAFLDLNRDMTLQADEPHAWAAGGRAIDPSRENTDDIRIELGKDPGQPLPGALVDEPLDNHLNNYVRPAIGKVTPLDSPLFSYEQAERGLWTPFAFVEDGGAGIHFLEPYDPHRIPVLFVHGISGTPRNFTAIIDSLDRTRYQAWVLSYPSGLPLTWVARGMYQFVEILHRRLRFRELHVVAHSMGGLVSRGALNLCTQNRSCRYVSTFTTISTPWNGVSSARNGVRWAPTAVPVWHDLDPDSEYIKTLFATKLPGGLPHFLLFGYRHDSLFDAESSDGVIRLTSQLRSDAQRGATMVRGFNEGHVSILANDEVIQLLHAILSGSATREPT